MRNTRNRSFANVTYDLIGSELNRRFEGDKDLSIIDMGGWTLLNIGNEIIARVKKLDEHGRWHYIETDAQRDYYWQHMEQMSLPGLSSPTNLLIGYQLDITRAEVQQISAICPFGNDLVWKYSLMDEIGAAVETRFLDVNTARRGFTLKPKDLPLPPGEISSQN